VEDTRRLAQNTVRGTFWNYTSFAVSKGLMFISTVILARILAPEDFGLLALGLIAINYLDILNELGIGPALIYHKGDLERRSGVAFTISLGARQGRRFRPGRTAGWRDGPRPRASRAVSRLGLAAG
jgi:hypothetical protein